MKKNNLNLKDTFPNFQAFFSLLKKKSISAFKEMFKLYLLFINYNGLSFYQYLIHEPDFVIRTKLCN